MVAGRLERVYRSSLRDTDKDPTGRRATAAPDGPESRSRPDALGRRPLSVVFHRTGKKVKGKQIVRFTTAWRNACEKAGCPVGFRMTSDERPCGISCAPGFPNAIDEPLIS